MPRKYTRHMTTPGDQRDLLLGVVPNSAGGGSYPVDPWTRLARFLVLGADGGSYYACERALTRDGAARVGAPQRHRDETGIAAKPVVVGMVANQFSIADPNDAGALDVVGFNAAAPAVIADFLPA